MNFKSKVKMLIDIIMGIMLFVLMSFQFTSQKNHEIAGAAMLILFLLHIFMNYRWYLAVGKGKYSGKRILLTVTDIAFLIDMIILMVSGIRMSRYVFKFLNLSISMELARNLHMVSSYTGFLLMGFHIGLHYGMIQGMFYKMFNVTKKSKMLITIYRAIAVYKVIAAVISVYGAYALIKRNFISYITLQMHFVLFYYDEPVIFYELDLLAITIMMIFIAVQIQKLLAENKSKGEI